MNIRAGSPAWLGAALVVLAACALSSGEVSAQQRGKLGWHGTIVPYLWFSNIDGRSRAGGEQVYVKSDDLPSDFAGRFEIGRKRLGALVEFSRGNVAGPIPDGEPNVGAFDMTITSVDLLATYEIGSLSNANALEFVGGIRIVDHSQKLDLTSPVLVGQFDASWVEPVIGVRYFTELGANFWFIIQSNFGGFTLGSEFAWVLDGEWGYGVHPNIDLMLRYRYMETRYSNDKPGAEEYGWDNGASQGWLLGVGFKW